MHTETLYADLMAALVCSLSLFVNLFFCFLLKRRVRSNPPNWTGPASAQDGTIFSRTCHLNKESSQNYTALGLPVSRYLDMPSVMTAPTL